MRSILHIAWVLTMSLVALLVAMTTTGAIQPAESLPGILDAEPDCPMPCWQGIRPGTTTIDEAVSLLSLSPFVNAADLRFVDDQFGEPWHISWTEIASRHNIRRHGQIRGEIIVRNGVVHSVNVQYNRRAVTLGDVMGQVGIPTQVAVRGYDYKSQAANPPPGYTAAIVLYYPALGFRVEGEWVPWRQTLWTEMPVQQVTLTAPDDFLPDPDAGPWLGAALRNYMVQRE